MLNHVRLPGQQEPSVQVGIECDYLVHQDYRSVLLSERKLSVTDGIADLTPNVRASIAGGSYDTGVPSTRTARGGTGLFTAQVRIFGSAPTEGIKRIPCRW